MQNPLVSVVLPVYNGEEYICDAIHSAQNQSYNNFEIIVIDDGSTDSTLSILRELVDPDLAPLILITQVHAGVASAFNTGLTHAKGKYIARMDADDIMHRDRLAKQVKFLDEHPEVGVVSCLVHHGGNRETQEGYARHIDWINSLITHEQISLNRFIDSPVCNPTVMFRKELVDKHGGALDGDFPEDYEMWLRWMDAGVRFEKIPEVLFMWNDLPTRLTRNDARYSPEAFERAKIKYLVKFIQQNNPTNRPLYVCGGGRITRRKSKLLIESGLKIGAYVDIDPVRIGTEFEGIRVIGLGDLPDRSSGYVVNFVSVRGAREELQQLFEQKEYCIGQDFINAG